MGIGNPVAYRQIVKIVLALSLCFSISHEAAAQDKTIDSIAREYQIKDGPGFSLAVVHKGELVFKNGYGLADVKNTVAIEADSSFRLASVTKQFTALCIAMLAERGKLKFDDDITLYLKVPWKGVTIQHLVYHTSGVPDYIDMMYKNWKQKKRPVNADAIRLFTQYKMKLDFAPGKKHEYSNTGYILLASIIEKVSGMTFPKFMQENIFTPLKMKHSVVWTPTAKIHKRVFGYSKRRRAKKFRLDDEDMVNDFYGDGAIYSTAEDMAKWAAALYMHSTKLVKKKMWKHIFTSGKLNNGKDIGYGFGWSIYPLYKRYGEALTSHSGSWVGFNTYIAIYPQRDLCIIILSNNASLKIYKLTEKIDKLYPK